MVATYFKSSDKARELAKYVTVYSLVSLFINYFHVTVEKIPFTDLPIPKYGPFFSVSVILSLIATYTLFQLLILYRSEFLDNERLELESIVEEIKEGNFGQTLPAAVRAKVDAQAAYASLQTPLRRTHDKLLAIGWIRFFNEIVLPLAVWILAIYVDLSQLSEFLSSLWRSGAIILLLTIMGLLAGVAIIWHFVERSPSTSKPAWRIVVLLIAGVIFFAMRWRGWV